MSRRKMIGTIFTVVISVLLTSFLQAQEGTPAAKESGGMGYSMFGRATVSMDDLNARLQNKGYSSMSNNFFAVGGGGHGIINKRLIIGGEGQTLLGESATTGNYESSIYITYGFFDLGYVIYSIKDLRIYPLLGIGAGGMNLKIAEKPTSLSLDEVLDRPDRGVTLTTGGFLLNFALGIDYLINFSGSDTERGGLLLGIRAGYTLSPFKSGWMLDEIEVSDAPKLGITGPYISFMFGGGGIGRKK